MKGIIAFSENSLWREVFKTLIDAQRVRTHVFSNLLELKDFLHQVDQRLILIEQKSEELDFTLLTEMANLKTTKIFLLTDKSDGLRDLDTRIEVILLPVSHRHLGYIVGQKLGELESHGQ